MHGEKVKKKGAVCFCVVPLHRNQKLIYGTDDRATKTVAINGTRNAYFSCRGTGHELNLICVYVCLGDDNENKLRTKGTGKSSITIYSNPTVIYPYTRYHTSNMLRLMPSHHQGYEYMNIVEIL
jgi:hypothetical protein